ncbi:hypothetical protein AB0B89_35290 [Sphaerisporangium sp. NPDC049002]|uniref:hypothetical protein n=1 Tax=unclassified Sphaerisporangium TaxID=2630420 RepID=UPI0033CD20C4
MNRRLLLVVTGWLVVGLVATGAGIVVTAFLGESITGSASRALSPAEIRRSLDASPSPSPLATGDGSGAGTASPSGTESAAARPSASASVSPSASAARGQTKVFSARGGTVVARCAGGLVTLRSWTPAQGYEVKDAERGPRDKVRVRFESQDARTEIETRCSGDHPTATIKND